MHDATPELPPSPSPQDGALPAEPTVASLELGKPTLWSRRMKLASIALLGALLWYHETILATLTAPDTPTKMLVMVLAPPLALALWIGWRLWDTPKEARRIEFGPEQVLLPLGKDTRRSVSLKYREIHGIVMMSRAGSNAVLIDTGERTLGYEDRDFAPAVPSHPTQILVHELNQHIRDSPDAQAILERMQARFELGRAAFAKSTPVTTALLALLGIYFAIELLTGALDDPFGLLRLGANAPALIEDGQYWRLISANFLHGGWVHIFFNGMALYFLGLMVEKLLGSWRFLLIYLSSAIAGALGSWWVGPGPLSVGASTAIFGLIGAFLVIHLRYWRQLPSPFRQSKKWWLMIITLNAGLPIVVPAIDYAAHAAGLAAGGLLTLALLRAAPELDPHRPASKGVTLMAAAVSALTVAGLIFGGIYAASPHPKDTDKVLARVFEQSQSSADAPDNINYYSWMIATDPKSERSRLQMARDAMSAITPEESRREDRRDTLATLDYRLAREASGSARLEAINRAIAIEIALLKEPTANIDETMRVFFGGQLARFLDYRKVLGEPVDPDNLLDKPLKVEVDEPAKRIAFNELGVLSEDVAVYFLVTHEDVLQGLLKGCLLKGDYAGTNPGYGSESVYGALGDIAQLDVEPVLVQRDETCRLKDAPGQSRAPQFWPLIPEVRGFP